VFLASITGVQLETDQTGLAHVKQRQYIAVPLSVTIKIDQNAPKYNYILIKSHITL
jgi:hypothetical protein